MYRVNLLLVALAVLLASASAYAQGSGAPPLTNKAERTAFIQAQDVNESQILEARELESISEVAPFGHKSLMDFCQMVKDEPALYGLTEPPVCSTTHFDKGAVRLWIKFGHKAPKKKK